MKGYWILLMLVVVGGFSFIGLVIFLGVGSEKTGPVYLNTGNMIEAGKEIVDSTMGPALISIYYCNEENIISDTIPWADAYVCQIYNKKDTLHIDTAVILDIRTSKKSHRLKYSLNSYWTGLKEARSFKACRIMIPEDQRLKFKKYLYKYAGVTLWTDD